MYSPTNEGDGKEPSFGRSALQIPKSPSSNRLAKTKSFKSPLASGGESFWKTNFRNLEQPSKEKGGYSSLMGFDDEDGQAKLQDPQQFSLPPRVKGKKIPPSPSAAGNAGFWEGLPNETEPSPDSDGRALQRKDSLRNEMDRYQKPRNHRQRDHSVGSSPGSGGSPPSTDASQNSIGKSPSRHSKLSSTHGRERGGRSSSEPYPHEDMPNDAPPLPPMPHELLHGEDESNQRYNESNSNSDKRLGQIAETNDGPLRQADLDTNGQQRDNVAGDHLSVDVNRANFQKKQAMQHEVNILSESPPYEERQLSKSERMRSSPSYNEVPEARRLVGSLPPVGKRGVKPTKLGKEDPLLEKEKQQKEETEDEETGSGDRRHRVVGPAREQVISDRKPARYKKKQSPIQDRYQDEQAESKMKHTDSWVESVESMRRYGLQVSSGGHNSKASPPLQSKQKERRHSQPHQMMSIEADQQSQNQGERSQVLLSSPQRPLYPVSSYSHNFAPLTYNPEDNTVGSTPNIGIGDELPAGKTLLVRLPSGDGSFIELFENQVIKRCVMKGWLSRKPNPLIAFFRGWTKRYCRIIVHTKVERVPAYNPVGFSLDERIQSAWMMFYPDKR